ncbi:MAG TPA: IspD/TarI family cytidylyltransferase, partial [Bacteroidota bacterium]|nr:IspD/TarI family cytidylyltransferase [Bacteroidota bacterium]
MISKKKIGVVIPAAGSGSRFGGSQSKQFLLLDGKPIVQHVIEKFQLTNEVDHIILVVANNDMDFFYRLVETNKFSKVFDITLGGKKRQDSVWSGLERLKNKNIGIVVVHDAVRPFVTAEIIRRVIRVASDYGGAITAVPPKDTIKITNEEGIV